MPRKTKSSKYLGLLEIFAIPLIGGVTYLAGTYRVQGDYFPRQVFGKPQPKESADHSSKPSRVENVEGVERDSTWSSTGDTIFAFGDKGRYFFAYRRDPNGTSWRWYSMVGKTSVLNSTPKEQIDRPYFYAWTSTDDELIGYMDNNTNKPSWRFHMDPSRPASAPTYSTLLHWLGKNVNTEEEMLQTKVVFGSKATYFAQNGKTCTYHDLPPGLHNHMLQKKYALSDPAGDSKAWIPRILALGPQKTFVAIWHDGDMVYSLSDNHNVAKLDKELGKKDATGVSAKQYENIVLSPFNAASYFRIKKTGHISWSVPVSDEGSLDFNAHIGLYSQVRAKEDGTTFEISYSVKDVTRDCEITPETNYTEAEVRDALRPTQTLAEKVESSIIDRIKALIW